MKKMCLRISIACLLFASFLAQEDSKSHIYIINKTGKDLIREGVMQKKGQKYAPKIRRKWGAPKKLEGYTCQGLYCKADARQVFWETKPVKVSTANVLIKNNETVKIAQIDRNQIFLELKTFKKKFENKIPNPDPKKFKTVLGPYSVFPFNQVITSLTGEDGSIVLAISSERIGLSTRDYAKSIALGAVGALGGSLVPVGIGLGYIRQAVGVGKIAKFGYLDEARYLSSELLGLENMFGAQALEKNLLGARGYKEGVEAARKLAEKAIGKAVGSSLYVAVPIMVIGTVIAVGIATISTIASLTIKAQKSGLTVLPFQNDFKFTQYLQEREGSFYPDLYITVWPK